MGFIEKLNKYGDKISLSKTDLYNKINEYKSGIEALGVSSKMNNEFDLFLLEIIYRGLMTQQNIENAYEIFVLENQDTLNFINYVERKNMFNRDIEELLQSAPHFYDEESQTEIYIPYLEASYNQQYTQDYQTLQLKQYQQYLHEHKVDIKTPEDLYGSAILSTAFSSLENVYEDERHLCLYFSELKTVYIFKKDTKELLNKVIVQDSKSEGTIDIEDVKKIMAYIETYAYEDCLNYMKEKGLICEKTYKKVLKKYK